MFEEAFLQIFYDNSSSNGAENKTHESLLYSSELSFKVKGEVWIVGWMVLLEYLLLLFGKKRIPAVHENIISMTHAVLYEIGRLFIRALEYNAYTWIWTNYALFPHFFTESILCFVVCTLAIDFGYYWFHRASHEVMLFWAIHQVHHISDELTVSVGLRHSPLQNLFSWIFYLPLAMVGLPCTLMLYYLQLNLLYQTWVHTYAVTNIGPLEWIFNSPSHHRVHHGSTAYCIDKNYGGIFIFWDYIFGTFEKERENEKIVYGILVPVETWNPFRHQSHYLEHMYWKAKSMPTWKESIETVWKGPSWSPGLSRLGSEAPPPDTSNKELTKANKSLFINFYMTLHLAGIMCLTSVLTSQVSVYNFVNILYVLFVLGTISNIGNVYDGKSTAWTYELIRNTLGLTLFLWFPLQKSCIHVYIVVLYLSSAFLWMSPFKRNIPLVDYYSVTKKD